MPKINRIALKLTDPDRFFSNRQLAAMVAQLAHCRNLLFVQGSPYARMIADGDIEDWPMVGGRNLGFLNNLDIEVVPALKDNGEGVSSISLCFDGRTPSSVRAQEAIDAARALKACALGGGFSVKAEALDGRQIQVWDKDTPESLAKRMNSCLARRHNLERPTP